MLDSEAILDAGDCSSFAAFGALTVDIGPAFAAEQPASVAFAELAGSAETVELLS